MRCLHLFLVPVLLDRRPVVGVIFPKLAHDRWLAVAVVADLRALHFEEIVQSIFAIRLRRVGDAEHRVRRNSAFQV